MTTVPSSRNDKPTQRKLWPSALVIAAFSVLPFILWPSLLTKVTSSDFMPHRFCYMNSPGLIGANVSADAVIGLSYIAIGITLVVLLRRTRRQIPFSWMLVAFVVFIVACGGTHLMEVLTVWKPFYWLSADVKIVTALASLITAVTLPRLVPKAVSLLAASKLTMERKLEMEAAYDRLTELERMSVLLAQRAAAGVAYWEFDYNVGLRRRWGDVVGVFARNESEISTQDQFLSVVHPDDREKVKTALEDAVRYRKEYDAEFRIITPDGNIRWLLGRGHLYCDADGNPLSMVGVNMDITSRKLSDAALQQSEKLAVTGRLAATIAHEINNPLSVVTDLVYSIAHEPSATATVQAYANLAQDELKRIAQIVKNTLGFHRESGSLNAVKLADLLDSALALYEPQLRKKKIRLEKRYSSGLTIVTQPGELRQVFANLVSNAIDALPEGGSLRVRLKSENGYIKIVIVDNGSGIPRDSRERLFQPFFTTKGEKGTGIGLWISRALIEKNGGQIKMRSLTEADMHGTAFSVTLPVETSNKEPEDFAA